MSQIASPFVGPSTRVQFNIPGHDVAMVSIGAPSNVHESALAARARNFALPQLPDGNSFTTKNRQPALLGGTVLAHSVDFELPVCCGTWHAALLTRTSPDADPEERVLCGVALWHEELVGEASDMAQLIRRMEDMGAGPIYNVASDQVHDEGIRLLGRYDWDYYAQCERNEALPATDPDKFFGAVGAVYVQSGGAFGFMPAEAYWDSVWPYLKQEAVHVLGHGAPAAHQLPQSLSAVQRDGKNVGAQLVSPGSEYSFGRAFLAPRDNSDEWRGAKAFLWWSYNMGDFFGECALDGVPMVQLPPSGLTGGDETTAWLMHLSDEQLRQFWHQLPVDMSASLLSMLLSDVCAPVLERLDALRLLDRTRDIDLQRALDQLALFAVRAHGSTDVALIRLAGDAARRSTETATVCREQTVLGERFGSASLSSVLRKGDDASADQDAVDKVITLLLQFGKRHNILWNGWFACDLDPRIAKYEPQTLAPLFVRRFDDMLALAHEHPDGAAAVIDRCTFLDTTCLSYVSCENADRLPRLLELGCSPLVTEHATGWPPLVYAISTLCAPAVRVLLPLSQQWLQQPVVLDRYYAQRHASAQGHTGGASAYDRPPSKGSLLDLLLHVAIVHNSNTLVRLVQDRTRTYWQDRGESATITETRTVNNRDWTSTRQRPVPNDVQKALAEQLAKERSEQALQIGQLLWHNGCRASQPLLSFVTHFPNLHAKKSDEHPFAHLLWSEMECRQAAKEFELCTTDK